MDLLVALYKDDENLTNPLGSSNRNISNAMIQILTYLKNKYPKNGINYIILNGNFSRGVALDRASRSNYVSDNDILFYIDVDIVFNRESIERIRRNTIKHKQVYLPIVFSEYDSRRLVKKDYVEEDTHTQQIGTSGSWLGGSSTDAYLKHSSGYLEDFVRYYSEYVSHTNSSITDSRGYFRQFGYGIVSIFRSDALNTKINGFDTDIKGWGLEDVKFLEKIIASNQQQSQKLLDIADGKTIDNTSTENSFMLKMIRTPDPSLVHIFHPIECDKGLDEAQYKMCLGTKANTLGSYRNVEFNIINNKSILDYVRTQNNLRNKGL